VRMGHEVKGALKLGGIRCGGFSGGLEGVSAIDRARGESAKGDAAGSEEVPSRERWRRGR